jgi:hypothetical protein
MQKGTLIFVSILVVVTCGTARAENPVTIKSKGWTVTADPNRAVLRHRLPSLEIVERLYDEVGRQLHIVVL